MPREQTHFFRRVLMAVAALVVLPAASAEEFPSRPLRMVVPFAPGGVADIIARIVGQKMSENLGQRIVIDNRAGAGGSIGGEITAKARPDGYTILLCSSSIVVINPLLSPNLNYDPRRDLATVSLLSVSPYVLLVPASSPFATVGDLVAAAKAKPGALNFGSAGVGSASHLIGEVFRSMANIQLTHVPYKGTALASTDLLAGQLQMMFESISSSLAHIKAGSLRPLGIGTLKPFALTPGIPSISESGVPGFEGSSWQGLCVPARTPRPVVVALHKSVVQAVKSAELSARFAGLGVAGVGNRPEEFRAFADAELERLGKVIRESGIMAR